MKKNLIALLILSLSTLASCTNNTIIINDSNEYPSYTEESTSWFLIWGFAQVKRTYPEKICNGIENVLQVSTYQSFLNNIIRIGTLNLVSPRTSVVKCRKINP